MMKVPITPSTSAQISGKTYLHGWIMHQFQNRRDCHHQLVAKARQFSSFLLLVGSITSLTCFEAKDANIIQNKELESSVFGLVVIEIHPQLEVVCVIMPLS